MLGHTLVDREPYTINTACLCSDFHLYSPHAAQLYLSLLPLANQFPIDVSIIYVLCRSGKQRPKADLQRSCRQWQMTS